MNNRIIQRTKILIIKINKYICIVRIKLSIKCIENK